MFSLLFGDKLFIDFTRKKLSCEDPQSGEVTPVEVYVASLGYSQLIYVQAVASQKKEYFIQATENALHFFGGVPKVLIPDNLKSAVEKADKYETELNSKVKVIYSGSQVSVFCQRERIAYHIRICKRYGYSTVKEHLSYSHRFVYETQANRI